MITQDVSLFCCDPVPDVPRKVDLDRYLDHEAHDARIYATGWIPRVDWRAWFKANNGSDPNPASPNRECWENRKTRTGGDRMMSAYFIQLEHGGPSLRHGFVDVLGSWSHPWSKNPGVVG